MNFRMTEGRDCLHESRLNQRVDGFCDFKKFHYCSVQDESLSSLAVPIQLMRTKMLYAAGFPVTSKDKISILFVDRLDTHILQVLRIVGVFVVLIVV